MRIDSWKKNSNDYDIIIGYNPELQFQNLAQIQVIYPQNIIPVGEVLD